MTKKRNPTITRDESSASNESSDTIATSTSQNQNVQDSSGGIDNQTRMYIDIVIQSTTEAIMRNMQQMMNQQIKNQRQWNTQCMETINQRFERLEQMNIQSDDISGNRNKDSGQMTVESNQQGPIETNRELNTSQGESGGSRRKWGKDIQNNGQKIPNH
ncbi:10069_t:CDS:2 [Gigaspora rosea]|nr:10069_t:CDS:2 [Gigaspora rosea]